MKYTKSFETRSYEIDRHDALTPTALVQYLQETADHQMHDTDKDYGLIYREERKAFVVSRMSVEIMRPVYKYAHVDCDTWVVPGEAANFPRAYELFVEGDLVARAYSNWALVDVDTRKLVLQSEYDMSSYPEDREPEMGIPTRFRIPKTMEWNDGGTVPVTLTLTDINGHMNNARYYNCLYDCIPNVEEYCITSLNMRFVHEAPLGSELKILRSDFLDPGKLDPRADKIVYFKTEANGEDNVHAVFGLKRWE